MPPLKLLFDVDTGVDDALALLFALGRPDVDVVGIGTVAGNVGVELCTENSLKVLRLRGRTEIPVAQGCDRPLLGTPHGASTVHGDDGLGNSGLPPSGLTPSREHAIDQLLRLVREHEGDVTLVATGPLTNVALALARAPELPSLLHRTVLMGGAFVHAGNVTPTAEFNVWADPEAARIVFESGLRPTIVPLDATMQALLTEEHVAQLGDGLVPRFVAAVTADYMELYAARLGRRAAAMHDPLATAIAVDPGLVVEAADLPVSVETGGVWSRGATIADLREGDRGASLPGRATVCFRADGERFFEAFLATLR